MLKALGHDYKDLLVSEGLYQEWTTAAKALENSIELSPSIVRNGDINSQFSANHLMSMAYYLAKAEVSLEKISNQLKRNN